MGDMALKAIHEARALLLDESKVSNSRELSMVITKLDEAELWRLRNLRQINLQDEYIES